MRFRLTRPALALSAVAAVLALWVWPFTAGAASQQHPASRADTLESFADGRVQELDPAVARTGQRDTSVERATKHGLLLVAVLSTALTLPMLLRRTRENADPAERTRTAAPSPFCGRAPPQLTS